MSDDLTPHTHPGFPFSTGHYTARLGTSAEHVRRAQRLRFAVFNEELKEGLPESWKTGHDEDRFDAVCDHLLVEETASGSVVGTYRLLTGARAADRGTGYYSAQEFDFAPFEPHREKILELGRACVASGHRNQTVIGLLWRGISIYARAANTRYLIGCSSLTTQDPGVGSSAYVQLAGRHLAPESFRTKPLPEFAFPIVPGPELARIPKLMAAYIAVGARICGEPALDRVFKTIDFLTLLDLDSLPVAVARKYLS
ncbi:MAG TPA: GNAT family N-acyltransferase [Opitutaceae bacterium]|nr:GNAT family N-acyltransferase [Opitutaceae bacterium]